MCAWFVVWNAVNRKGWRSLFLCVWRCWKTRAALEGKCAYWAFLQAFLSAWQYLANSDGRLLELSWQVFMQVFCLFVFYSKILILYSSLEMLRWDSVHECMMWHVSLSGPPWEAGVQCWCFHSVWSRVAKAWIHSAKCSQPFACGYPGRVFSRRGQVSQLTVAMQQ